MNDKTCAGGGWGGESATFLLPLVGERRVVDTCRHPHGRRLAGRQALVAHAALDLELDEVVRALSVPHDDQVQALLPGLGAEPERPAGGGRRKRRGTAEPRPRAGGSPREGRHEHFRQAIWREGVSNLHPLAAGMQRMLRLVRTGATWGCGGCGCGRRSMSTQIPSIWQQSAPLQKVAVPVPCPHFVPSHLRPTGSADALLCVRATVL